MAYIIPILQVVGAVVAAVGAMKQGEAQKKAADYNATVNQQNAQISRDNARQQAAAQERENYLRLGQIRANAGASGGDQGQGSVLDVIGDIAAQGELAKQNIMYEGELRARGYTNTATLDTAAGKNAQSSSYWKAGSELLGGGMKAYDSYNKLTPTRA